MRLHDAYAGDVPTGSLIYPSRVVQRKGGQGNYYLEDMMGFVSDSDIFPAMVLPDMQTTYVKILTPTGVHMISRFSLISHQRKR